MAYTPKGINKGQAIIVDQADAAIGEYVRMTANGIESRSEAELKEDANLQIGTDVQAYDAELTAIAGLISAADKVPYFTASETADMLTLATGIGATGNDITIVSEQGIREALNAKASTTHSVEHVTGASDELDGDKLDIDYTPTYYTPATAPSEVTSVDHLGSHLYGIDQALATSGGGGSESDKYQDLLSDSIYMNCSWDDFLTDDLVDNVSTDMTWDDANSKYTFTIGEILQSDDLYDSVSAVTVTECMVSVDYTDSGTPTIQATADGTNWETVTDNVIHTFTNTGTTLKLRFTAGGTGEILSWGVIYNLDSTTAYGSTPRKYVTFNYEGIAQDEETLVDGFYFDNNVGVDKVTLFARVAPTGADLTIDLLKDGFEQTKIATLATTSTYELTTLSVVEYYATTERFGLKLKSVGSIEPGQSLTAIVHYYDR